MENYTLVLQSSNAINRTGADNSIYQYFINWGTIIPNKHLNLKYNVNFSLNSGNVTTDSSTEYSLHINFGSTYTYNQNFSSVPFIGLVNLNSYQHDGLYRYRFEAKSQDNAPIMIEYPTNSTILVQFKNAITGASVTLNSDYIIVLTITPII